MSTAVPATTKLIDDATLALTGFIVILGIIIVDLGKILVFHGFAHPLAATVTPGTAVITFGQLGAGPLGYFIAGYVVRTALLLGIVGCLVAAARNLRDNLKVTRRQVSLIKTISWLVLAYPLSPFITNMGANWYAARHNVSWEPDGFMPTSYFLLWLTTIYGLFLASAMMCRAITVEEDQEGLI